MFYVDVFMSACHLAFALYHGTGKSFPRFAILVSVRGEPHLMPTNAPHIHDFWIHLFLSLVRNG